ncbi:RimK/LysX family protein [Geminocystis sp. GBBB08]|uniref:ATP-dependent zinc protease family protein n=1 Tax=Geminocystis sp. GBBB08 TaxID=2604140 RepID=UPI0027E2A6D2|nr:RimK/LysX family protein [Geminocystis sp. GBBB08]MBL1209725.1 aspartyl protease [Geminocystis sp. GBBB08]
MKQKKQLPLIGWREYIALPALGVDKIKVKIDTGARTSALHALHIDTYKDNDREMVKFQVHPIQRKTTTTIDCIAPLLEYRHVTNSGGYMQLRPVILTTVKLGGYQWNIELTLTNRDMMGFRMLLGRQAIKNHFLVDSGKSFLGVGETRYELWNHEKNT